MRSSRPDSRRALVVPVAALLVAPVLLAALATVSAASDRQASVEGLDPVLTATSVEHVAQTLQTQLDAVGMPGGAVAVVSDGRVDAMGVGEAGDRRSATADTPFVIGSATKSFTALAVMQLVDAGEVGLDAPVRRYVPELELSPGEPVDAITVRHLLQQTSGLDDLTGGPLLASGSDGAPVEAVAELAGARLVSVPGERWRYANANYVLAGLVVERASGLGYGDYVQQRIFEPLQMTHSHITSVAARADGLSEGHRFWFGLPVGTEPTRREATLAAGYLVSTAEDLGRYLAMLLSDGVTPDGTRVLSRESLDLMVAPAVEAHLGPWADGQASRYAMGWFRGGPWGGDATFHPGNTPDTSTLLLFASADGVAVATVVNAGHELPVPGNPAIADRVTRNVAHAALDQPAVPLPSLQRFYLWFDLVALTLVAGVVWGLVRAQRAALEPRRPRRAWRWVGVAVRSVLAAALVALPVATAGWAALWTWAPDLAAVIAVLASCLAVTAVLRLVESVRAGAPGSRRVPAETTERDRVAEAARP